MNDESYVPQRWQGMLFYWAVLVYSAVINTVSSKVLPHVNYASGAYYPPFSITNMVS